MKLLKIALMAGLPVAALATLAGTAHAAGTTCTISSVFWASAAGGGELQINCGGTWYYADTTTATCTGQGAENLKTWLSLSQAAYLAGRSTTLSFSGVCLGYIQLN